MSAVKLDLTPERVKDILHYDPLTGVFTWLKAESNRIHIGDTAGSPNWTGYFYTRISGKKYSLHRLAWLYTYGAWPKEEIDHINGRRGDNRICNLREATHAQNCKNLSLSKSNTSGFRGVSWDAKRKKWCAIIVVNYRHNRLGYFDTPEAASAAYEAKATELFGTFKRNNTDKPNPIHT